MALWALFFIPVTYLHLFVSCCWKVILAPTYTCTCSSSPTCSSPPRGLCWKNFQSCWRKQCSSDITWILFGLWFAKIIWAKKIQPKNHPKFLGIIINTIQQRQPRLLNKSIPISCLQLRIVAIKYGIVSSLLYICYLL